MRNKGDFLWTLLVLVATAVCLRLVSLRSPAPIPRPQPHEVLRLELATSPDFSENFQCQAFLNPNGSGSLVYQSTFEGGPVGVADLAPGQLARTFQALEQAGLWQQEATVDDNGPEQNVLYTRLTANWEPHHREWIWRGIPAPQARIARALLDSPLGSRIQPGLEAVQVRKARPQ